MDPNAPRKLETEMRRVLERVGHCLIIYQRIEISLKYLLPYTDIPNKTPTDTFAQWKSLLDSRRTLGPLIEDLREAVSASDLKGFGQYLSELVEQRNDFVHHFSRLPFGRLRTLEECDAAFAHLNSRIQFALPFHEALEDMLRQFRDQLMDWKLHREGQ